MFSDFQNKSVKSFKVDSLASALRRSCVYDSGSLNPLNAREGKINTTPAGILPLRLSKIKR